MSRLEPMTPERKAELIELCVELASDLAVAVRDVGTDSINGILARIPPDGDAVLHLVMAAMINPDQRMRDLLGWTERMTPEMRGKLPHDPPAERERQRLTAAGVHPDVAIQLAAAEARQERALPSPSAAKRHLTAVPQEEEAS